MPDTDPDREEAAEGEESGDQAGAEAGVAESVERSFTCAVCGFPMVHGAAPLQVEVSSICHNCGDWTLQTAERSEIVEAAEGIAERLAGPVLTERQALAYLLREVVDLDRGTVAEAMDSSPSNVDNLYRRATEKVDDARCVVEELERVQPPEG